MADPAANGVAGAQSRESAYSAIALLIRQCRISSTMIYPLVFWQAISGNDFANFVYRRMFPDVCFEIFQFAMAFALRLQVAAKDIHHSEQLAANFPRLNSLSDPIAAIWLPRLTCSPVTPARSPAWS